MDISLKKLDLIRWLTDLNDVSVIKKIDNLKQNHAGDLPQSPISTEEMTQRHLKAEDDIKNDRLHGLDQVKKHFEEKANS